MRSLALVLVCTGALACDDLEYTEHETRGAAALPASFVKSCERDGHRVLVALENEPFTYRVQAWRATESCHCKYTEDGCAGERHCTSHYDLGASNPDVCTTDDRVTVAVREVSVEGNAWCTGEARIADDDPTIVEVTARCLVPGSGVSVRLGTDDGHDVVSAPSVLVTNDGECPDDSF